MPNAESERLLQEIGRLLAEDKEYPLDGTLLHADADLNYVRPSIFKDRGNHIVYRSPDLDRLGDAILSLWEAEDPTKRWAEMTYLIKDSRFQVDFTFPEEIDPEEEPLDRRDRVVARFFGAKPILYPPPPGDDDIETYRL